MKFKEILEKDKRKNLIPYLSFLDGKASRYKEDVVEEICKRIFDKDRLQLILFTLTDDEYNYLKDGKKLKISDNNIANLINLDKYHFGYFEMGYFIFAGDVVRFIRRVCDASYELDREVNSYICRCLDFAITFYGIFTIDNLLALFRLNPKFDHISNKEFESRADNLNLKLKFASIISNGVYFRNVPLSVPYSFSELEDYQSFLGGKTYLPSIDELEFYYKHKYLDNYETRTMKKMLKNNYGIMLQEYLIRQYYLACIEETDDYVIKRLCKNEGLFTDDTGEINMYFGFLIDNYFKHVRRLIYRGYNEFELDYIYTEEDFEKAFS